MMGKVYTSMELLDIAERAGDVEWIMDALAKCTTKQGNIRAESFSAMLLNGEGKEEQ